MAWLQKHRWSLALNAIALVVFVSLAVSVLNQTHRLPVPTALGRYFPRLYPSSNIIGSPLFRDIGHWAVRFLLFSLAMSPLYALTGWRTALTLRKPAGLWAFGLAVLHVWLFASDVMWGKTWYQTYTHLGLVAFIILTVMAATSFRLAMRLLQRNWKRLHRLVYVAGALVVLHGLLAAGDWSKISNADANLWEMRVYCVILVVLLALRLPPVRALIHRPVGKAKRQPEAEYVGVFE